MGNARFTGTIGLTVRPVVTDVTEKPVRRDEINSRRTKIKSEVRTLSIAKDLETALVERHFSKLSSLVPGTIKSTLTDLAAQTEGHRKVLAEALDSEKRQSS